MVRLMVRKRKKKIAGLPRASRRTTPALGSGTIMTLSPTMPSTRSNEGPPPAAPSDLSPSVPRRFGRFSVDCMAVLSMPARQAHPRLKGRLFQIGRGGCAIATVEKLFIGEECLVWASGTGHKLLGARGRVVWVKSIYLEGRETMLIGIEFATPVKLTDDLLEQLRAKARAALATALAVGFALAAPGVASAQGDTQAAAARPTATARPTAAVPIAVSFPPPAGCAQKSFNQYQAPTFGFCARGADCRGGEKWMTQAAIVEAVWWAPSALAFEALERHYRDQFRTAGWIYLGAYHDKVQSRLDLSAARRLPTGRVRGVDVKITALGLDGRSARGRRIEYWEGEGAPLDGTTDGTAHGPAEGSAER